MTSATRCRAAGLDPSDLVLELTETALLQVANSTISGLRTLRADGVGIAIDDFGVGYASLRYLATLPVSAVKIDRSFTAGLPHDQTSRKIVKAVAALAADMGLTCIVEGVETEEQRAALPTGVQLQGFLTGRPQQPETMDVLTLCAQGAATSECPLTSGNAVGRPLPRGLRTGTGGNCTPWRQQAPPWSDPTCVPNSWPPTSPRS